jgi:hypothetical protein
MRDLAANSHIIPTRLHEVHHVRIIGIPDLIKTFYSRVVRISTREQDIAAGVTASCLYVSVMIAKALLSKSVDLRCSIR